MGKQIVWHEGLGRTSLDFDAQGVELLGGLEREGFNFVPNVLLTVFWLFNRNKRNIWHNLNFFMGRF